MGHKIKPWEHVEAEEGGDDQWIVSYADMVTLLFGFFVILYSFSTFDENKFDQMGEKLAAAFKADEKDQKDATTVGLSNEARQLRALQLLVAMMNLGDNMDQTLAKIESAASSSTESAATKAMLTEKMKEQFGISTIRNPADPSIIELVLPERILFSPGAAELSPEAQRNIVKLGRDLLRLKDIERIEVVGHTDSSPPSKTALFKTNFALSSARAGAVAQELMKAGLPAEMFSVKGMGDLEPLADQQSTSGAKLNPSANRRVHLILRKVRHDK